MVKYIYQAVALYSFLWVHVFIWKKYGNGYGRKGRDGSDYG